MRRAHNNTWMHIQMLKHCIKHLGVTLFYQNKANIQNTNREEGGR
jgi:hypothetical protein